MQMKGSDCPLSWRITVYIQYGNTIVVKLVQKHTFLKYIQKSHVISVHVFFKASVTSLLVK